MKNIPKIVCSVVLVFLLLIPAIPCTWGGSSLINSEEPLIAYRAKTIPEIDGIVSDGEWNDTKHYSYELANIPCRVECALEHDDQWLYILFSIYNYHSISQSDNPDDGLIIYTKTCGDLGVTGWYNSDHVFSVVMINRNGEAWDGRARNTGYSSTGIPANATGICADLDDKRIFEVKLNLTYYNIASRYIPFNIGYYPYFGHTFSIGYYNYMVPGMILTNSYYTEEAEPGKANWPITYIILLVAVAVGSSGLTTVYMKKRISRQREEETPPPQEEEVK